MRFRVDGQDFFLGPGEGVTLRPRQAHQFWNEGEGRLVLMHEVQPPGRHREMFHLWHRLDLEGKTNRQGVPTSPLALGPLWELQDGYVAGVPAVARLQAGHRALSGRLKRNLRRCVHRDLHQTQVRAGNCVQSSNTTRNPGSERVWIRNVDDRLRPRVEPVGHELLLPRLRVAGERCPQAHGVRVATIGQSFGPSGGAFSQLLGIQPY
jgi:hypothetical protein